MATRAELEWGGERLTLLGERAIYWRRAGALLVADLHLGKDVAFRRGGVPVPEGSTRRDLDRLSGLLERTGAKRVIVLGDLLHARAGRGERMLGDLSAWRTRWCDVQVMLVRGNHDVRAGDPPRRLGFVCVDEPFGFDGFDGAGSGIVDRVIVDGRIGDGGVGDGGVGDGGVGDGGAGAPQIVLAHHPPGEVRIGACVEGVGGGGRRKTICGHVHPVVKLERAGGLAGGRASCFWVGREVLVMPAFGTFTGGRAVQPVEGDRVFVVKDGEVAEVATVAAG